MEPQDTITIAPSVLITIAQQAATQHQGVSHMGNIPVNIGRLVRGQPTGSGVVLEIVDNQVTVDAYIVIKPDVSIKDTSNEVQQAITRSINELVGMDVVAVNVHVEDVNYGITPAS